MIKIEDVIKTLDGPGEPAWVACVSSLDPAPDGGVVKSAAVPKEIWRHPLPARVFEAEEPAMKAILSR